MDAVRVLIVGQDPYPTPGHPVGLSFSVAPDVRPVPRSLANIYTELSTDLGLPTPTTGDLTPWAERGVLLLNRVLTVAPGASGSHRGKGWEQVTAELAFERSGPERLFSSIVLFDQWLAYVRTPQGRSASAQRLAGKVLTQLAPLRAMSVAIQDRLVRGQSPIVEAALVKELGTTLEQMIPSSIADDLFARDAEDMPVELLMTLKYITEASPSYSLRGGTRDILRGMIARGLGLR